MLASSSINSNTSPLFYSMNLREGFEQLLPMLPYVSSILRIYEISNSHSISTFISKTQPIHLIIYDKQCFYNDSKIKVVLRENGNSDKQR